MKIFGSDIKSSQIGPFSEPCIGSFRIAFWEVLRMFVEITAGFGEPRPYTYGFVPCP